MSYFTPADAEYLKGSVRKIMAIMTAMHLAEYYGETEKASDIAKQGDAELARLFAFIDGCTLEKGKGSE